LIKKITSDQVKNYPVKGRLASYLLQVKSKLCLGQGPSLTANDLKISKNWKNREKVPKLGKCVGKNGIREKLFFEKIHRAMKYTLLNSRNFPVQ